MRVPCGGPRAEGTEWVGVVLVSGEVEVVVREVGAQKKGLEKAYVRVGK